jgi:GT2 family glycosyltransferase
MNAIEERKAAGGRLKSLFASGGSVALKKPLFLKLGGFLSIYKPFYNEDMDLCTRAWIRGWQTLFEPRSKVVHDHVGTIKTFFHAHKIRTIRTRNRFLYLWLYCSRYRLTVSHIPWTSFRLLLRLLRLDTSFPIGLLQGLTRLRTVMALRSRMKSERLFKPLDHILNDINA